MSETQTIKLFTVHQMTFKGDSRSLAMSPFTRLPVVSIRDRYISLQIFSDKIAKNDLDQVL